VTPSSPAYAGGDRSGVVVRYLAFVLIAAVAGAYPAAASDLAPTGTLRAAFLGTNPVQGRVDATTGEIRGPVADITRALAERDGVPFTIVASPSVAAVIEAVKSGIVDIGFIAFDASRAVHVAFSQPYLLSHNTYIVRADSAAASSKDLDRPNVRIGISERDSGDLFLTRTLQSAKLIRRPSAEIATGIKMLLAGELDAYAANRTRLLEIEAREPGLRVLPDNFFSPEQSIVVARANSARLAILDRFIAEARASGLIQAAIERAGLKGVDVAPAPSR
jgi:polar amino acid transport system substrate-binding protein